MPDARPEGPGRRFGRGLQGLGGVVLALGLALLLAAVAFGAVGLMLGPLVALVGLVVLLMGSAARRGPGPA